MMPRASARASPGGTAGAREAGTGGVASKEDIEREREREAKKGTKEKSGSVVVIDDESLFVVIFFSE